MTLRQRHPRQEDEKHLAFVRAQPCCICGSTRNVEAAHLKMRKPEIGKEMPGMSEKADDRFVTALCRYHHRTGILAQHSPNMTEQRFWFEIHGRDPFEIAERLWIESGGPARAVQPTTKARKRKSRPFPQGRKLQSRGFEKRAP
jgi:hypothetical protein